jgi:hypothetical protein
MDKVKERRALDRLTQPQTSVFVIKRYWFDIVGNILSNTILRRIFRATILKDISKSGACILSDQRFNWGDPINLIVLGPGEKKVRIKGRVQWISFQSEENLFYVGTQFLAFGKGKRYNSFQCQELLRHFNPQNPILSVE